MLFYIDIIAKSLKTILLIVIIAGHGGLE